MENGGNALEELLLGAQTLIETWGWPILLTLLAIYFSRPYIDAFMKQQSLRSANNPQRRQVLEKDMRRVRMQQTIAQKKAQTGSVEGTEMSS
jgi:hypothetical protein